MRKNYYQTRKDAEAIKNNFGSNKFVQLSPMESKLVSIEKYPQKIAVLINGKCASTAEWFILELLQSKKVTLMGQPTKGIIDYILIREHILNCDKFGLVMSIGQRTKDLPKNAIDNIGIQPKIKLSEDSDWVEYAKKYLKTQY